MNIPHILSLIGIIVVVIAAAAAIDYGVRMMWSSYRGFKPADPVKGTVAVPYPNAQDPMGQRNTPDSSFQQHIRDMIASEVQHMMRGRSTRDLDGLPDQILAMELIARGWVTYKPSEDLRKGA